MRALNENDDDALRALFRGGEGSSPADQECSEVFAAYQKVEALFDLLRRPATAIQAHTDDGLAPGKVLGEFAILRPLASGGMGQVYLARQESLGRLVALKVCKPEIARDPRMKSRFMAEGRSLALLSHPNVVPVLSTGEDQCYLHLAMEYVAGPTLAQVLQAIQGAQPDSLASAVVARVLASSDGEDQSRPWGESPAKLDRAYQTWVVQVLQQVAQGLAAAHAAGILHRDIKPANIVFAANGVPKIVDFGLARIAQAPSTTVVGEFYGTPAYTSPEQARGDAEAVSPASDVFSFGVTLFESLSLRRPFTGRTSADVLSAVLKSDPSLLRKVEKRIPWELEAITDKCLRKTPAERYPSAQPLADDLRNYLELRPVSARPISELARVGRMIRRRPWVAAFLFTLVSAAALGVFVAKNAWADYKAEQVRTFNKRVDEGDIALFRCLTGQRPTWLPAVIEKYRQEGITAYSAALEFDPNAVRPLVQRARLYATKKKTLDLALADLDKAQQVQPGFRSIRKFRGIVLGELGREEEGRAAREEPKRLDPTSAEDLYWLGVIAHSTEQDFFASYTYFSQALLLAPNDYWSRLERAHFGRIASEENIRQRVIPELDIAKTLRPDVPFASELLERFYSGDRLNANAIDSLRQKKELDGQIERFGLDLLRAHSMAAILQKEKNYEEAGVILRKVLVHDPGGVTAEMIGDLEYRTGHYQKASDWYHRAISEGTRHSVAYRSLADAFTAMQDWKGAESAYLDGIAEHPKRPFLYNQLGYWYRQRNRIADAEKIYRKGCELSYEFEGPSPSLAEISGQIGGLASCFQSLASLLGEVGRQAEKVQVLERGITQLKKALATTNRAVKESVENSISELKGDLGQAYLQEGRRQDAVALIDSEVKKKPFKAFNARMVINLLRLLGMEQAALEAARLAEFTTEQDTISNDRSSRWLARGIVDGQLWRMGLFNELRDRLETRRATGEDLGVMEYRWFGTNIYQGAEAVAILSEGVKKYPDSMSLITDYMEVLSKAGRKDEAWKAYERARDLYFALVQRTETPAVPGDLDVVTEPLTVLAARPWYLFLLQEGKDDEFRRLEARLRKACLQTKEDAKNLLIPRAFAEFGSGRYAAAVETLESCVKTKMSDALVNTALAKSLRALGRRQEAIKWYRSAVQMSGIDPGLLSEFLCLVVELEGSNGLLRELPSYDQARSRPDARLNAILCCFSSWAAAATGDEKAARESFAQADPYLHWASQKAPIGGDDPFVCGIILQIVSEELGDSKQLDGITNFLKRFPAERVRGMREVFLLPKRK
jgi:serine/threonine protein kinase/tetratricopeptide (TPR) repeat protein